MNIDFTRLAAQIADGYIVKQKHTDADLFIYNYTPKAQYERYWTPETLACRGLILDGDQNIVARPFAKFFNLGEREETLPAEPFDVFEKMDGSLGILYFLHGTPYVATRGSFGSEQSQKATQMLRTQYADVEFDPSITYLFEIIYPENRIVVDYGEDEKLVLLGMVETATGRELPLQDIGLPVVKQYDGISDIESLRSLEESNREGFVVRFRNGFRVKVKFDEYCRLHRIITGVNSRVVWEHLKDEQPLDDLIREVPDEFYRWISKTAEKLQSEFAEIERVAQKEFKVLDTRKETAAYFQQCTYPSILFSMLDDRDYSDFIWRQIRPAALTPFGTVDADSEEV